MNVGDKVFVRWYGDVVEGKVVNDGNVLTPDRRMIVVRIPIQGLYCHAVFVPEHVYKTAAEAAPKEYDPAYAKNKTYNKLVAPPVVEQEFQTVILSTDTPSGDFFYEQIQEFKESHWDHEHNHLMIESLDEFYEIWKRESRIIKIVPKFTDADIEKLAEEFANYDGNIYVADAEPTILLESNKEPVSQNDTASEKPKKSNPTVIQLSLFD